MSFWCGFALTLAALGLYYYHIAGSLWPWTLYSIAEDAGPGFSSSRVLYGMGRYLFDWRGGVIAHAPVFLLALPGLIPLLRRPRTGLTVIGIVLGVAAISAARDRS